MQYSNMTPDDLIRHMADTHIYNRLKAIITCARAVEFSSNTRFILPDELYIALELCLHDGNELVQQAASITLYALERPVVQVATIFVPLTSTDSNLFAGILLKRIYKKIICYQKNKQLHHSGVKSLWLRVMCIGHVRHMEEVLIQVMYASM